MVGSKCCDFKNREVSNVNAPTYCPSARQFIPTAALNPGEHKWGPGRIQMIICEEFCQGHLYDRQPGKEYSPGSGNCAPLHTDWNRNCD